MGLFIALFSYEKAYANKIYRNIYVGNLNMSGKTAGQADTIIKQFEADNLARKLTLKADDKTYDVTLAETGLTVDSKKIIDGCFSITRSSSFFGNMLAASKTIIQKQNVPIYFKLNQAKFDTLNTIVTSQMDSKPTDGTISIKDGTVAVTEGTSGIAVDISNIEEQLQSIFNDKTNTNHQVLIKKTVLAPSLTSASFDAAKTQTEIYLNKSITLKFEDKTYTPSKSSIGGWIDFGNNNGQIYASLNDNKINAYLSGIAKDFEVKAVDTKVNANDGSVIQQGSDGRALDYTKAITDIKSSLSQGGSSEIALQVNNVTSNIVKVATAEGLVLSRYQGKYLDVNLTSQALCQIETDQVIACYPVSSGKASMPTPPGSYTILDKNPMHYSNEYFMWLPWWEEFDSRGYGIHELPQTDTWKETPEHLGTPVSHGCVRLGVGPAESVYNWTDIGTPLYIHK